MKGGSMQALGTNLSKYTGGEVLRFVVAYTGAEPSQWDHHTSFLKHLRRCGVPDTQGLRRGPAAQYRYPDLFQLAVAIEMTESGMTAAAAARVVTRSWAYGLAEAPQKVRSALSSGTEDALLMTISRTSFDGFERSPTRDAWRFLQGMPAFDGKTMDVQVLWASDFKIADFFSPRLGTPAPYGQQRRLVVNLSRVVQAVDGLLANIDALNAMPNNSDDPKPPGRYRR